MRQNFRQNFQQNFSQISTCGHGGKVDYVDFVIVTPFIICNHGKLSEMGVAQLSIVGFTLSQELFQSSSIIIFVGYPVNANNNFLLELFKPETTYAQDSNNFKQFDDCPILYKNITIHCQESEQGRPGILNIQVFLNKPLFQKLFMELPANHIVHIAHLLPYPLFYHSAITYAAWQ